MWRIPLLVICDAALPWWIVRGWYTGEARKMLIVVARKSEMQNIMRVTKMVDPDAFLTMNTVMGVYGRGFDTLKI